MILEAVPVTFQGTAELTERHEPGVVRLRRSPGPVGTQDKLAQLDASYLPLKKGLGW
jgi:hypothetical protein